MCPVFEMMIKGITCLWLLDTGASKSVVTPKFIEQFPNFEIRKTKVTCKGANNEEIPLKGEIDLTLDIAGESYSFPFLVSKCPLTNLDGLVGLDFLTVLKKWCVGGSRTKGAYLSLNGAYLEIKAFVSNNYIEYDTSTCLKTIISNSTPANCLSFPIIYINENEMKNDLSPWQINVTKNMDNISMECTSQKCFNINKSESNTVCSDMIMSIPKDISTLPLLSEIDEENEHITDPITNTEDKQNNQQNLNPDSCYYDSDVQCVNDQCTVCKASKRQANMVNYVDSDNSNPMVKGCEQETSLHHKSNYNARNWRPMYSLLFQECQNSEFTYDNNDDDLSKCPIYALRATDLQMGGCVTLNVRSNYSLKSGTIIFTPAFDIEDKQLVNLVISKDCNKRATIKIFNNSSFSQRIINEDVLGYIEEISTDDIFTPDFKCTGDRNKYGNQKPWSSDSDECQLFSTLVSINQQVNVYKTNDDVYLAGPSPSKDKLNTNDKISQNISKPKVIKTIIANLADKKLFKSNDIICQQVNCSMRTSHGLSRFLATSYPYGSVYLPDNPDKRNVLPDNLLREPGKCILKTSNDENSPIIANITGQFYCGNPTDKNGVQQIYQESYNSFIGNQLKFYLKADTAAQRLIWFQNGLDDLKNQIINTDKPINLYFPEYIGCKLAGGNQKDYKTAIHNFSNQLQNTNIKIFMVKDPSKCSQEDFKKFKSLYNIQNVAMNLHSPGLYETAPVSFCKDPNCKGCPSNKMILKLLHEDLDDENNIPVDNILNGMQPEIPKVNSIEERNQLFAKMLQNMETNDITKTQENKVKQMISKFAKLFLITDDDEPGIVHDFEASIDTIGSPISCKPRRFGEKALKIMEQLNKIMCKKGLTIPCDGPWASPVVLVKKKSLPGIKQDPNSPSSYRFCIDYRKINQESVVWKAYPTGDLRAMLHKAAGHVFNTSIDVTNAFHCICVKTKDQPKTAFQLPSGLWAFTRLPQGLKISPQIWAKAADKILKPVQDIASWYVDDIFCGSNTFEEHLSDVERVLNQLLQSGLKIRFEKCTFFKKKVKWLGHILSKEGIQPDPEGIQVIKNLKRPKDVKELRSVLGSMLYFKDFIEKFSDLTAPLYRLLKKNHKFLWQQEQQDAFDALKDALTSEKVLIKPDFGKDFYLQTDASDVATSAILAQKDDTGILRPIQYWSKKLTGSELNYFASEKEAFAIYLAFKKFETYCLLNKTHVITDASALKAFYGTKEITSKRILRWSLYVGQFDHTVTHIKGPDNVLADLVSRCVEYPSDVLLSLMETKKDNRLGNLSVENIKLKQEKDNICKTLLKYVKENVLDTPIRDWKIKTLKPYEISTDGILTFTEIDDVFGKKAKIVVPKCLISTVLYYNHDTLFAGHQGINRTLEKLRSSYHWLTMQKDVQDYVLSCNRCQKFKTNVTPYFTNYVGTMKVVADLPNEILFVDIAYSQRSQEGYLYILVIIDAFSRFMEALPIRTLTAQDIIKELTNYCCVHGFPSQIFTDSAGDFKKAMISDCSHLLNVRHHTSIPWRHQSNTSERYIQLIKSGIRLMIPEERLGWWPRYIRFITYALNTSRCKSLNMSPFEAYFARQPNAQPSVGNLPLPMNYQLTPENWIQEFRTKIKETSKLMKSKYQNNVNNDIKKPYPNVIVNQLVMIRRNAFSPGISQKLQAVREGPLRVTSVKGSKITLVFLDDETKTRIRHISDLAKYFSRPDHLILKEPMDTHDNQQKQDMELEPGLIDGNLWTVDQGTTALLAFEWDSLTQTPNIPLSLNFKTKYAYFNKAGDSIPLSTNNHFVKTARDTGSVYFHYTKTRHGKGPVIATMVTKIIEGPSAELRDVMNDSIPFCHLSSIKNDSTTNRHLWLKTALTCLKNWIISGKETLITAVYFDIGIFHDDAMEPGKEQWTTLKQFTWEMNTHGIKVFTVKMIVNDENEKLL